MRTTQTLPFALFLSLFVAACWTQFTPPPADPDDDDTSDDDDSTVDDDDTAADDDDTAPTGCLEAATISCGEDFPANNNSPGSTNSVLSYSCSSLDFSGPEYAVRWDAPTSGLTTVEISGIATGEDLDLFVLSDSNGAGCDPQSCVDSSNNLEPVESVSFNAVGGQTYYFVVDGYSESISNFMMSLECDVSGDDDDDTTSDDDDSTPDCADPPAIAATVTLTDPLGTPTTSLSTSDPMTVNVSIENTAGDSGTTSFTYASPCLFTWSLAYTNGNPVDGGPDNCPGGLSIRDYSCGSGAIFDGDTILPIEGISGNPVASGTTLDLIVDTLYFGTFTSQVTVP